MLKCVSYQKLIKNRYELVVRGVYTIPKVCNRHRFGAIGILMANASVIQVADHFGVLEVFIFGLYFTSLKCLDILSADNVTTPHFII